MSRRRRGTTRTLAVSATIALAAAACGSGGTAEDDTVRNITLPVGRGGTVVVPTAPVVTGIPTTVTLRWVAPRTPATSLTNQSRTQCRPLTSCAPVEVDYTARPSTDGRQSHDFVAVAFGDSFASGEGAPYQAFTGPQPSLRGNVRFTANDPKWPRGGGGSYDQWFGPQRCHRSSYAPFTQAMARLATEYPEVSMAFRNFACSGATSVNLFKSQEMDFLSYVDDRSSYPPQASVAREWLGGRAADLVYMNMGGNDAGFSKVIQECATLVVECDDGKELGRIQTITSCIDTKITQVFQIANTMVEGGSLTATVPAAVTAAIEQSIRDRQRVTIPCYAVDLSVQPGSPFIRPNAPRLYSVPPMLTQYRNKDGRIMDCGDDEDDFERMEGFPDSLFDGDDMAAVRLNFAEPLFTSMRNTALSAGWELIDQPDWRANGICAEQPYVNNIGDAIAIQGSDFEADAGIDLSAGHFHPNRAGFTAWAQHIYPQLEQAMLSTVRPEALLATTVTANGNLQLELQTIEPARRTRATGEPAFADGRTTVSLKVEAECKKGTTTSRRVGETSFPFSGINGSTFLEMASPCGTDTNVGVKLTGKICLRNSTRVCTDLKGQQVGTWVRPAAAATTTTTATTTTLPRISTTGPTLPRRK